MSINSTGSSNQNYVGRRQKTEDEDQAAIENDNQTPPAVTRQTATGDRLPQKGLGRFKVKQADSSETSSVNTSAPKSNDENG